jgi:hypothetical protein
MDWSGQPIGLFTTNRWITAMLRLFRPQIIELVGERDAAVHQWQQEHPGVDVFEGHGFYIASTRRIPIPAQIERVNNALHHTAPIH